MRSDFRKGPRRGQWVWVQVGQERMLAILDGPDDGRYRTRTSPLLKGAVEVVGWPSQAERRAQDEVLRKAGKPMPEGRPGVWCVSVLELNSRQTAFHVLEHLDQLTPVVARSELPEAVLATMAPDYVPAP